MNEDNTLNGKVIDVDGNPTVLRKMSIDGELQDFVMETFKFTDPLQAFESGMVLLNTFAEANRQGCNMVYFVQNLPDGTKRYFEFNFSEMFNMIKTRPNETCVHKTRLVPKE